MPMRGASRSRLPDAVASSRPARERGPIDPRSILTSIGEVVYDWDISSDAIAWGVNGPDVFAMPDMSSLENGRSYALAVEPGSGTTRHDAVLSGPATDEGSGVPYRTRYGLRLAQGRLVMVEDSGRWYADADGRPAFAHGAIRVERSDGETGSAASRERSAFITQIGADVVDAGRTKRSLTVIVAAIDQLDRFNDELGFEIAEGIIAEVMRRIQGVMRRRDKMARYASNRFAVALLSCPVAQAEIAAKRISAVVESEPIPTPRGPLMARVRVGAASAPEHATDATGLLRRAEDALGMVKRMTEGRFAIYDPRLARESGRVAHGTQAIDIIQALNDRRVVFARQPIVDAHTRKAAFGEALVRIRGTDGRFMVAGDLIPAVERAGLVPLVDTRMLELTGDYLVAHPDERLSINLSPLTLETPDWLTILAAHLGARPGIAARLIIEITETAAVRDPEATRARLDAMKALGVAIAIDDFGAGHTSFRHLRSFPIDILKIDGAFVQNLSRSPDDRFFVRTLVDLANNLGIATVAEWVEDEETARLLAGWGVDYLQGDHCGKPALAESPPQAALKTA